MEKARSQTRAYLKKITEQGRVPHALLMVGPEGAGQLELALEWCKMLLCPNKTEGEPCNNCKSCHKISEFVHPDIHFAFPVVKHDKFRREETTSKHFLPEWRKFLDNNIHGNLQDWLSSIDAMNKNANINVAECHQIIHNLGLKSYQGQYKIQIIWHTESLAKEGNRLLKLIEEPSEDTVIILLANNLNAILNTIQSRCQILRVPAFKTSEVEEILAENYAFSEAERLEISHLSEGNIRKAIEIADHNSTGFAEDMLNWFRICYKADPEELVQTADKLGSMGKIQLKNFLKYTLHFLREYHLAYNVRSTDHLKLSKKEVNVVLKMQKIIDRHKTALLTDCLNTNLGYIDRNLSIKIMIMNMSIKINEILRSEVDKFVG